MNTVEFLDAVRDAHGLDSDNKLAAFLDMNRGQLSQFRTGSRKLNPIACRKVAEALDVPTGYVLAEIQAEKARKPEDRAEWKLLAGLAKKGQAAGLALLAITGLLSFGAQDASAAAVSADNFSHDNLYIIRIRLSRLLRKFRRNWGNVNRFGPQLCHTATAG